MNIAVIGLGYAGLSLAVHLSRYFTVTGIDTSETRLSQLKNFNDINNEVTSETLSGLDIKYFSDYSLISECQVIIFTIPTPLDSSNKPDLSLLINATEKAGRYIQKDTLVIYESTVYPGVTEEICIPLLKRASGLPYPGGFKIGYSPERINPGDKEHTIDKVVKVIAADNPEALELMEKIYAKVAPDIYIASSIKTAEMAKVFENTQRDINIALMNEIAMICHKLGLETCDVLETAETKWNFLPFKPGLVGGHCIGVDPYYLTYKCEEVNYHPRIILAGRSINDSMGKYIAEVAIKKLIGRDKSPKRSKILIMGATFKENVRDIRNSKVWDIVSELREYQAEVFIHDPLADSRQVKNYFGCYLTEFHELINIDCVILAIPHNQYKEFNVDSYLKICSEKPIFIDIKSVYNRRVFDGTVFDYWSL